MAEFLILTFLTFVFTGVLGLLFASLWGARECYREARSRGNDRLRAVRLTLLGRSN